MGQADVFSGAVNVWLADDEDDRVGNSAVDEFDEPGQLCAAT